MGNWEWGIILANKWRIQTFNIRGDIFPDPENFDWMKNKKPYKVEEFTVEISADDYIRGFRDAEKFMGFCRDCGNYGKVWGCPPFDYDQEAYLRQWSQVRLLAVKITPAEKGLPLERVQDFIRPERIRIERLQREWERESGGRSFAFVGKCLYCESCTRPQGLPCRHPDLVRPSLEAFGFDIGKTLTDLFGIELRWSTDGRIPDYLTLVSGYFH